jgi:hypothetical protein
MTLGPYMNESGDWWVPVEAASFRKARREVVMCLDYTIPDDGTLRYAGKSMAWLDSEHEAGCDNDCPTNRHVLAFHFEENRRW